MQCFSLRKVNILAFLKLFYPSSQALKDSYEEKHHTIITVYVVNTYSNCWGFFFYSIIVLHFIFIFFPLLAQFTNRCLLKWLKLWDTLVFGKEKAVKKAKPIIEQKTNFRTQKEQQTKWKTKAQITEEILEAELDQHNRPKYKVTE